MVPGTTGNKKEITRFLRKKTGKVREKAQHLKWNCWEQQRE